ncbi:hypothetical protein HRI_000668400 [Hibiscus trionum]|uniref:Uncharacterized protein n=1 Tax=Hibiscus trionum TaxID=183268 RepID=A0A9W7H3M3_HIBTR|nr:hypothetical protein HRI_000668400 [Hibiscus trionum]
MHASHARIVPGDDGLVRQQTMMSDSAKEQANATKADSPKANGIDEEKNFIYGGVGGYAGMGGYAGVVGGLPLLGGLGGIGKYGGIGGAAGIGGLGGMGGLGGLGGGVGGAGGDGLGGPTSSGVLPPP